MPASPTDANGDTNMQGLQAFAGDLILIYLNAVWSWRVVRAVCDSMDGRKYNVPTVPGQSSILLVPHKHVFAIKTSKGELLV